jgi:hypothetical protein
MTRSSEELTIDELLRDPMTRAIMKADRVDAAALEAMLRSLVSFTGYATCRRPTGLEGHASLGSIAGESLRRRAPRQDLSSSCFGVMRNIRLQLCGTP